MTTFTYQVISRGKILRAQTVSVDNREYQVIKFPATFDMAPMAHLLVYYFDGDDIRSAHTEINLRNDLQNFLKLKVSSVRAQPGATVDIEVNTNARSFVGLLGVDQSVLLLKKNDDLNKEDAFSEMEEYQNVVHDPTNAVDRVTTPDYLNRYWHDFHVSFLSLYEMKHWLILVHFYYRNAK